MQNKKYKLGFPVVEQSSLLGFTLIELIVVVSIIGLLSSIVLTSLNSSRAKARDAKRMADKRQVILSLNSYYSTYGSWPNAGLIDTQYCLGLPSSGFCWLMGFSGSDALMTALSPFISSFPTNNAPTGIRAYDQLLYSINTSNAWGPGSPAGAWLVWVQENGMTSAKCPNLIVNWGDGYLYCYEHVGLP